MPKQNNESNRPDKERAHIRLRGKIGRFAGRLSTGDIEPASETGVHKLATDLITAVAAIPGKARMAEGQAVLDRKSRKLIKQEWLTVFGIDQPESASAQRVRIGQPLEFIFADGNPVAINEVTLVHALHESGKAPRQETTIWLNPHSGEQLPEPRFDDTGSVANRAFGSEFRIDVLDGMISVGRKSNTGSGYQDVSFETQEQANAAVGYLFSQLTDEVSQQAGK